MKNQIYPCLWFDGQAKAAAEFYCSVFPHSKITIETPMVVVWELSGKKIMGLNGGPVFKINPSISLFVNCESVKATNEVWEKLIEGGMALMPIDKYPWSERYGWLQDKFGMTWQLSAPIKDEPKFTFSPSMLFTGKGFGRAEEAINFYCSVFGNSGKDILINYGKEDANAGKVMFSEFKLNGYNMIAMDGPGAHDYTFNEGVSFVITCENQQEIDYYWDILTSGGGEESMCGWCRDKFGVSWQVIPSILGELMSDPNKGPGVVQAFLKMKKFDIEKLITKIVKFRMKENIQRAKRKK